MIEPIQVSKNLNLDESKKRQYRRIKEALSDAAAKEIYIDLLINKQKNEEYFGEYTSKDLDELKEESKIEVRKLHNKLAQFIDWAVNGGFEDEYEDDKFENEWSDFEGNEEE